MLKNIFKTAFRSLQRNPLHSTINIVGLSMGLATVFLIVLWIQYHRSFDNFHKKGEEIYEVMTNNHNANDEIRTTGGAVFKVMEEAKENVGDIGMLSRVISNWRWPSEQCFKIAGENKPCIYAKGLYTDSIFFRIFDFDMVSGVANPLEKPRSIAISEQLAKKLFGKEDPVGQTYKMDNNLPVTVTAVFKDIPSNSSLQFEFAASLDVVYTLWMGSNFSLDKIQDNSFITYVTIPEGKAKSVEKAMNELPVMASYENSSYMLLPLKMKHLYSQFENGKVAGGLIDYIEMFVLFAIFILVMSVVNFVNLSTARATIRSKEIGVRKVNGATKYAIMGQFLMETFIKVVMATGMALLVVHYTLPLLNILVGEHIVFTFDQQWILFLLAIIGVSTLFSGAYPAFILSRFSPVNALKSREKLAGGSQSLRRWLTLIQISLSVVIIIVTAVIFLQLQFIQQKSLGYDRQGIMMLEPTWNHIKDFDKFKNDLLQSPLISDVGIANANMIDASYTSDQVDWPGKLEGQRASFKFIGGDSGLLDVFELKLLEGTGFNNVDTLEQVILTKSAVEQMQLKDPIDAKISWLGKEARVVGIIPDFNSQSLHNSIIPTMIYKVAPRNAGTIYIRYDKAQPEASIAVIRDHYNDYEKFFSMKYQLLDEDYQKQYKSEQVMSKLSASVMFISIIIALVGIMGLSTYNVIRRYKEIGIRKVFGASVSQLMTLLSKDFVLVGLLANLIAWPVAWYIINRWLTSFAYHIDVPYSLFGMSFVVTTGFIVILVSLQSLRTALMNPADVVREE